MSTSTSTINDMLDRLGKDKEDFRKKVESAIRNLVENTSRNQCVALIRRYEAPSESEAIGYKTAKSSRLSRSAKPIIKQDEEGKWVCEWQVRMFRSDAHIWIASFVAMVVHSEPNAPKFHGTEIDSFLTLPITQRVQELWIDFIQQNQELISESTIRMVFSDSVILNNLAEQIVLAIREAGKDAGKEILGDQVRTLVKHKLGAAVVTGTGTLAGKAAAGAFGQTLAQAFTAGMAKILAPKTLAAIVGKVFFTVIGKMAIKKALISLAKTVAAAYGVTLTGAALAKFLIPFVLGYAAYEIIQLPKKLGARIAPVVAKEIMSNFRETNENLLKKLCQDGAKEILKTVPMAIVGDKEVMQEILERYPISTVDYLPPKSYSSLEIPSVAKIDVA